MRANNKASPVRVVYKRHKSILGWVCVYCDKPGNEIDHVPAISRVEMLGPDKCREIGLPLIRVRSCRECNNRLGDKPLYTVRERFNYINGVT